MTPKNQELKQAEEWRKKGWEFYHTHQFSESLQSAQKAALIFKKQEKWESYVDCLHNWSKSLWKSGKVDEALQKARETLKIGQEKLGEFCIPTAQSFRNLGLIFSAIGNLKEALTCHKESLHIRLKVLGHTHPETIKGFFNVGNTCEIMGSYDEAIHYYQKSLQIQLQLFGENNRMSAMVFQSLGTVYWYKGMYYKAISYFKASLKTLLQILGEFHPDTGTIYECLGLTYCDQAKLNEALHYHQKSLEIRKNILIKNNIHVAFSYGNIGIVYQKKGDYEKAIHYYQKGLQIKLKYSNELEALTANSYTNLGGVYLLKGDYEKSIHYQYKSLNIHFRTLGSLHPKNADCLGNIGIAYLRKMDYEKALYYHQKTFEINLAAFGELNPDTAKSYSNMGIVFLKQGNYEKSNTYLTKALELKLKTIGEWHPSVVESYLYLGQLFLQQSNYNLSTEHFQKALNISIKIVGTPHPETARVYLWLGRVEYKRTQYFLALQYLQYALEALYMDFNNDNCYKNPILQNCLSFPILLEVIALKAKTFLQQYEHENSISQNLLASHHTYHLATDLIIYLRHSYQSEGSKLTLAQKALHIYEEAIQVAFAVAEIQQDNNQAPALLAAHQEFQLLNAQHTLPKPQNAKNLAFTYSEQSKAILLYSNLKDSDAKITAKIPSELLQKEYDLRIELNYLDQQIAQVQMKSDAAKDEKRLLELQSQHFDYKRTYDALIKQFEKNYPDYFQFKYNTSTATVEEVQKHLQEQNQNTTFIAYFVGTKHLTIFCITSNEYITQQIEKPIELDDWITDFQEAINMAELEDFVEMGTKLYAVLLKPIEKQLEEAERLIIVRDDVLHYVAFEALLPQDMEGRLPKNRFADLPYLLQQFEVSYHYSATLLLHQANLPQLTHQTSFIGFAPITFDGSEVAHTELALESTQGRTSILRSNHAGETALQTLPNTENEVKNVYQLFENQRNSAKVFLYGAASKQNLQQFGVQSKYLLIATHGLVNEQSEHLSGIYLAKVKKEAPSLKGKKETDSIEAIETVNNRKANSLQSDYVLSVAETYHLQMNTDLVVLSSCSSGIGALQKGEGIMAINRAFLYAGARNIIFTQFDIPDKSSSDLVVSLFEEILEGKTYAAALRKAKQQLMQNPHKSPKGWAAYVLIGGK